MSLETAILKTLAYSDIFDYPLNLHELHRYLVCPATQEDVLACVKTLPSVGERNGYYFLANRDEIVERRVTREVMARRAYRRAVYYGRVLGSLPFVRMVALTGSLAVINLDEDADLDYMLVTAPNRLWIARAFSVIFARILHPLGYAICVNLLISKNELTWPVHDLYSAREMCQMVPVKGMDVYHQLRLANAWTNSFLPNAAGLESDMTSDQPTTATKWLQRLLEFLLGGQAGDRLEAWAQSFQIRHIAQKYGTGHETRFTVDVCQGNFHGHRQRSAEHFRRRLSDLGLETPRPDTL